MHRQPPRLSDISHLRGGHVVSFPVLQVGSTNQQTLHGIKAPRFVVPGQIIWHFNLGSGNAGFHMPTAGNLGTAIDWRPIAIVAAPVTHDGAANDKIRRIPAIPFRGATVVTDSTGNYGDRPLRAAGAGISVDIPGMRSVNGFLVDEAMVTAVPPYVQPPTFVTIPDRVREVEQNGGYAAASFPATLHTPIYKL